jgi:GNAT superfamily N-acetyltransferase
VTEPHGDRSGAIRPATFADIPEIRSILAEHGNDGPHTSVDIVGPYLRHLIAVGRTLVAEEDAHLVGFGATLETGRGLHLADLFVRRNRLGGGIGRQLLDGVYADRWPRTTFASDDPRAMPLYIRAGMAPLWTCLYLEGTATLLPGDDRNLTTQSADSGRLAALELDWTGIDRSEDHAFWASQADGDPFVVLDNGDIVAAGYGRARQNGTARALDRLLLRPDHEPIAPAYAALRRVARGGIVLVCLPGPHPAARRLLEAGFRLEARDTYMASEPDLLDPARLLPTPGML